MGLKETAVKTGLEIAEFAAKKVIDNLYDEAAAEAKAAMKDLIPGQAADGVADLIVDTFAPKLKEILKIKAEDISVTV